MKPVLIFLCLGVLASCATLGQSEGQALGTWLENQSAQELSQRTPGAFLLDQEILSPEARDAFWQALPKLPGYRWVSTQDASAFPWPGDRQVTLFKKQLPPGVLAVTLKNPEGKTWVFLVKPGFLNFDIYGMGGPW